MSREKRELAHEIVSSARYVALGTLVQWGSSAQMQTG